MAVIRVSSSRISSFTKRATKRVVPFSALRKSRYGLLLASGLGEEALEAHARRLAEGEKLQFVGIQRAKLLKKQLIEIDGERFLITGKRVMRNATEISLCEDEIALLQQYLLKRASKPCSHVVTAVSADDLVESAASKC